MQPNEYNVVIVGAGPAGLSAAIELKKRGVERVIVLERFFFPRYKCCAGYITAQTKKTYEKLGLDIEKCHYSLIKDFRIFYKRKFRLNIINRFLFTNNKIDRVELDFALYAHARNSGVDALQGVWILKHYPNENRILLSDEQEITYHSLVFADGTSGFGSRYQPEGKRNIALQLTFPCDLPDQIEIHFGISKRGYGWLSSYGGNCNLGLTDVYREDCDYRALFSDFMKKLNLDADLNNLRGAFTPIGIGKPIVNGNLYFIGDAVGACDPLTLSGLRYALTSGEKCAEALALKKPKIYTRYVRRLKRKFRFMRLVQKVFYWKSTLFFTFQVLCRFFGKFVSFAFNRFFVRSK